VGPRTPSDNEGRQKALAGDLCICGCSPPPKLLANQSLSFQEVEGEPDGVVAESGGGATRGGPGGGGFAGAGILVADATGITPDQARMLAQQQPVELDYRIALKRGGNRILTPLEIPDFAELKSGNTKNTEKIDFVVTSEKEDADSLLIEVLDGTQVIYSDTNTSALLPKGEHDWQWDGYDSAGVLDTKVLKRKGLKIRLTVQKGSEKQVKELKLENKSKEVDWVDAKVDRNAKTVEITVRPSFTDGGVLKPWFGKKNSAITPKSYADLLVLAKQGIERYWSRDGSRGNGIGQNINTAQGAYTVKVIADLTGAPKASSFKLIENLTSKYGRSRSKVGAQIVHNAGYWYKLTQSPTNVPVNHSDSNFKLISAHEFGHRILDIYGKGSSPDYSWGHKGTSTGVISVTPQKPLPNTPRPKVGEIDIIKYSDDRSLPGSYDDYWQRSIASEVDVKGLLWLTRIGFDG
jgi:hypothetical protein